jgi:High potential iron-sulfur protein
MKTKLEANYIDQSKRNHCEDCTMFRKLDKYTYGRCTLVEGKINEYGHCKYFERKSSVAKATNYN